MKVRRSKGEKGAWGGGGEASRSLAAAERLVEIYTD